MHAPVPLHAWLRALTLILLAIVLGACSEASFTGNNRKAVIQRPGSTQPTPPIPGKPGEASLHLACDDQGRQERLEVPQTGLTLKVTGELCPTRAAETTLLFVVDFSGSMGKHKAQGSQQFESGNDPRVGNSCGRLQATLAVVDAAAAQAGATGKVRAGLVVFAGNELGEREIPVTDLAEFRAQLSTDSLCSYVVQSAQDVGPDNPGGIRSGEADSSTNYRAAFQAASRSLGRESGEKRVYFISDGEPTSGGNDPKAAGIAAAESLRALPGLALNALLLRDQSGQDQREEAEALRVLTAVVGSSDRVRVAARADELAKEILSFPDASVTRAEARIVIGAAAPRSVGVRLGAVGASGAVSYALEDLRFAPTDGPEVELTVGAQTAAGEQLGARIGLTVSPVP